MITEDMRELRKRGVGGSDIGAIMGLSPFSTPLDIYKAKTEDHQKEETQSIEWGNRLEAVIAQKYIENHPDEVVTLSPETIIKDDWMIANLDGRTEDKILEIKTANAHSASVWEDSVPASYHAQVQWYMAVTGLNKAVIAVLIGGNDYREYEIERDDLFIQEAVIKGKQFWENLKKGIPPAPINTKEAAEVFPSHEKGKEVTVSFKVEQAVAELERTKLVIESLKKQEERIKAELMNEMQDAEVAKKKDGTVIATWKRSTTKRFNVTNFKEANPEMYEQFKVETSYRTLRLK